jgi:hypothetical protein
VVLWNYRKPLIQNELERLVVSADNESTTPDIWAPMPYCLRKINEFPLIGCQAAMSRWKSAAKERDGAICLVENCPNA